VIVARMWAMRPVPGVRLTLVSRDVLTPYSGMLPGLVAGHYTLEQSHIDLGRLCSWSGIRFIEAEATTVDPDDRRLCFGTRPDIEFDLLSIDTGAAPDLDSVKGAAQFSTPVKPVHLFYQRWLQIMERANTSSIGLRIAVVGAGAGGFEILMAMRHRLRSSGHRFHWIIRDQALGEFPERARTTALGVCRAQDIQVHDRFNVVEVESDGLRAEDGRRLEVDEVLWCTEARASDWPAPPPPKAPGPVRSSISPAIWPTGTRAGDPITPAVPRAASKRASRWVS